MKIITKIQERRIFDYLDEIRLDSDEIRRYEELILNEMVFHPESGRYLPWDKRAMDDYKLMVNLHTSSLQKNKDDLINYLFHEVFV